jgi:hypothetical protein
VTPLLLHPCDAAVKLVHPLPQASRLPLTQLVALIERLRSQIRRGAQADGVAGEQTHLVEAPVSVIEAFVDPGEALIGANCVACSASVARISPSWMRTRLSAAFAILSNFHVLSNEK